MHIIVQLFLPELTCSKVFLNFVFFYKKLQSKTKQSENSLYFHNLTVNNKTNMNINAIFIKYDIKIKSHMLQMVYYQNPPAFKIHPSQNPPESKSTRSKSGSGSE